MYSNKNITAIGRAMRRAMRIIATTPLCAILAIILSHIAFMCSMSSCRIEPPLKLASQWNIEVKLGEVITDIEVVWNIDEDWRSRWWYGWDEEDVRRWGEISYEEPTNYEGRFYHFDEALGFDKWTSYEKQTLYEKTFRHPFDFGYHDMVLWSNIDSKDGTQMLVVDENDMANIFATTSRTRLSYAPAPSRSTDVYYNPEVFYAGSLQKFYISNDTLDYDYFDRERNAWVKQFDTHLFPKVYIYLVQLVIYHNYGRVIGLTDNAAINNLANGVNINTGRTSDVPVNVCYDMRLKKDLPARDGQRADIFGSKFTTFGLCDMEPWETSRATLYAGSRIDLRNHVSVSLQFNNDADSAYYFDVTEQLQRQSHGGLITLEVDLDTLGLPASKNAPGVFDPTVELPDSIIYDFPM